MTAGTSSGVAALLALTGLSACASTSAGGKARMSICQPSKAAGLVGQVAPDNDAILHRTGSKIVRRIAPGDAVTEDFREERVTVTVAGGRVVAASCG